MVALAVELVQILRITADDGAPSMPMPLIMPPLQMDLRCRSMRRNGRRVPKWRAFCTTVWSLRPLICDIKLSGSFANPQTLLMTLWAVRAGRSGRNIHRAQGVCWWSPPSSFVRVPETRPGNRSLQCHTRAESSLANRTRLTARQGAIKETV